MKSEFRVGVFVFVGFIFMLFLTTQVSKFNKIGKDGYIIYTSIKDASGIEENSK